MVAAHGKHRDDDDNSWCFPNTWPDKEHEGNIHTSRDAQTPTEPLWPCSAMILTFASGQPEIGVPAHIL